MRYVVGILDYFTDKKYLYNGSSDTSRSGDYCRKLVSLITQRFGLQNGIMGFDILEYTLWKRLSYMNDILVTRNRI